MLALDPNSQHMSLAVLRKIRDLVNAGAVVVGPKPIDSPSLADNQAEFRTIADQLWGPGIGKGKVYGSQTIAQALDALQVTPDFEYTKPRQDTSLMFVHRKARRRRHLLGQQPQRSPGDPGRDLPRAGQSSGALACRYRRNRARLLQHRQRPHDRSAPPRRPMTRCSSSSARRPPRRRARCPYRPKPFSRASPAHGTSPSRPDRGAPAKISLDALSSWSDNSDPGVKYFSGTATYTKTIQAPADWFKAGAKLWLDLGDVKNIAEVSVNGKPSRHSLEAAVSRGCDFRAQSRRQYPGNQGDQPLGQPARSAINSPMSRRSTRTRRSSSTAPIRPCFPRASSAPCKS